MIDTTGSKSVERLGQCTVEPLLGGISIAGLAVLRPVSGQPAHEAMRIVKFTCAQGCGTELEGPLFFSPLTACDPCIAAAKKAANLEEAKARWLQLCPAGFRETDKTHAGFPKAQYSATKGWCGGESLLLFGPTGRGKTRLAMLLLKRCLVRYGMRVGVLWPEQLRAVKSNPRTLEWVESWGSFPVLLMDDPLSVAAADSRVTECLKDLLDLRLRHKRPNIVTSQIGGEDYTEQAGKFGKETKADKELIKALLRRLRETCRVVPFTDAAPASVQGEADF